MGTAITGRDLTARQILAFAALALALVTALDLIDGSIGFAFSLAFVLIVGTAPLAVEPRGIILTGFLPPALMLASIFIIAVMFGDALVIAGMPESTGFLGHTLAGVIDRGVTLLVGTVMAVAAIGVRYALPPLGDTDSAAA